MLFVNTWALSFGGGTRLWTPKNAANLLAYYDASDVNSVTVDGSSNVSEWRDKSGNGYDVGQGTSSRRPGYLSGRYVNFPGSGDPRVLNASSRLGLGADPTLSVSVVVRTDNQTGVTENAYNFCTTANVGRVVNFGIEAATANLSVTCSKDEIGWRYNNGNNLFSAPSNPAATILSWFRTAGDTYADSGVRDIGSAGSFVSSSNGTASPTDSGAEFRIGGHRSGSTVWVNMLIGRIYELVLLNDDSTPEIEKVEGYLAHKWDALEGLGLVAALPGGHAYKSKPPYV